MQFRSSNKKALLWVGLLLLGAVTALPGVAAPPGLIGQWRNPEGTPFAFDGNHTVTVRDSPTLDLPDGASWTLEAWIFPTTNRPGHIMGKRTACGPGAFYQIAIDNNAPGTGMGVNPEYVPPNTWSHVVLAAHGSSGWTVYANGIAVKTVSSPGWRIRNPARFQIGGSGTCARFIGYIDEVSLYNRALGDNEVRMLFLAGRSGQITTAAPRPPQRTTPQETPPPRLAAVTKPPPAAVRDEPDRHGSASSDDAWIPRQRLALVIGNSRYGGAGNTAVWPDLEEGPTRDADAMAERLRALRFEVMEVKNRDMDQMNADLRAFADRIARNPDSLALFYFSGHGARAPRAIGDDAEETYLIPVGSNLQYDADAHSKALGLTEVSNVLRRSRAGVVILDACRNNALRRASTRAAGIRGLGTPENVSGMLFAYSTSSGDVAENRPGQMSEYTELLVRELGLPGQSLTGSFRSVRKQIARVNHERLPELTDQLNDEIVLVPR